VKVAWIAHHDIAKPKGGAEFTDAEMIARAPAGTKIEVVDPRHANQLDRFDRVVVSRLEHMPAPMADKIARTSPVFFSHGDVLPRTEATRRVVRASRPFIAQTELSLRKITEWAGPISGITMVPYMDLTGIRSAKKEDFALWPHRDVWHKGWDLAQKWAQKKGVRLVKCSGRPRSETLDMMAVARWVVLLSKILDGCPRSIREAQLSGCEIVVNENVGVWDLSPAELRRRTLQAPAKFWRIVSEGADASE
jgi:hypothetical protein